MGREGGERKKTFKLFIKKQKNTFKNTPQFTQQYHVSTHLIKQLPTIINNMSTDQIFKLQIQDKIHIRECSVFNKIQPNMSLACLLNMLCFNKHFWLQKQIQFALSKLQWMQQNTFTRQICYLNYASVAQSVYIINHFSKEVLSLGSTLEFCLH